MTIARRLLPLALLALGCGGNPGPAPAPALSSAWPPQADSGGVWARNQDLLAEQAKARASYRLPRQAFDSRLAVVAFEQARHCAAIGTLTHDRPNRGETAFSQIAAAGYPGWNADGSPRQQENAWWGGTSSGGGPWPWTAGDVVRGWMGSAGHRENVLGDFDHAGFGWARAKDGSLYVFGAYGKR